MNWVGDLVQKQIRSSDTVISLGCGIMQGLGNWAYKAYPDTVLKCGELWGVDAFEPYLNYLQKLDTPIYTIKANLEEDLPLLFPKKSFDVVLLLDILEHLPSLEVATRVINEAIRLAKRRVLVITPSIWTDNTHNLQAYGFETNVHQKHYTRISKRFLEGFGFKVKIVVDKDFYGVKKL